MAVNDKTQMVFSHNNSIILVSNGSGGVMVKVTL